MSVHPTLENKVEALKRMAEHAAHDRNEFDRRISALESALASRRVQKEPSDARDD